MSTGLRRALGVSSLIAIVLYSRLASAQAPPTAAEQFSEAAGERADERQTQLEASAGGTLNTGNTRSLAVNAGVSFNLRRGPHVALAEGKALYTRASLRDPMTGAFGPWQPTSEGLQGRLRYDFFFTDNDAVFAAVLARRDPFAGLDLRFQFQIGYLRNLFLERDEKGDDAHRLWVEVGYDFTYDDYHPDPLIDPMTMMVLDGSAVTHSARAFAGYTNQLNPAVRFKTGFEALLNVIDFDPIDLRLEWVSELRSTLVGILQASLDFTLRYDSDPVPGTGRLDTITTLNLVASVDFEAKPAETAAH